MIVWPATTDCFVATPTTNKRAQRGTGIVRRRARACVWDKKKKKERKKKKITHSAV